MRAPSRGGRARTPLVDGPLLGTSAGDSLILFLEVSADQPAGLSANCRKVMASPVINAVDIAFINWHLTKMLVRIAFVK